MPITVTTEVQCAFYYKLGMEKNSIVRITMICCSMSSNFNGRWEVDYLFLDSARFCQTISEGLTGNIPEYLWK